jgi:hypothetical protein
MSPSADPDAPRSMILAILGTALVFLGVTLTVAVHDHDSVAPDRAVEASSVRAATPPVGHVFVINIENKGFHTTWGPHAKAPYLSTKLRAKGVLLRQYYGTAHHSLGNYLAQISGQGPSYDTQHDCVRYSAFHVDGPTDDHQQVQGTGCVYPASVDTLPRQLTDAGLSWKGYMQDMATPCQHPTLGSHDQWQPARRHEQYATRHNPFMYFRSITDHAAYCKRRVVNLSHLTGDLRHRSTTPALSYITPDLCHDAHDATCADGGPGGLKAANQWMKKWGPRILQSPAFRADGMLVITADESEGPTEDSRACCGESGGPNAGQPGIDGPGGGRIGALVISPYAEPGSSTDHPYNHYSLLATMEDLLGVPRIGYAVTSQAFGADVFNAS